MSENVEGQYRPEQPPPIAFRIRRDPIKEALEHVAHLVNNGRPPRRTVRLGPLVIRLPELDPPPTPGNDKPPLFSRFSPVRQQQEGRTIQAKVIEEDMLLSEGEKLLADWHYRRPIPILVPFIGIVAIRPFWRDGRPTPPMRYDEPRDWPMGDV